MSHSQLMRDVDYREHLLSLDHPPTMPSGILFARRANSEGAGVEDN